MNREALNSIIMVNRVITHGKIHHFSRKKNKMFNSILLGKISFQLFSILHCNSNTNYSNYLFNQSSLHYTEHNHIMTELEDIRIQM